MRPGDMVEFSRTYLDRIANPGSDDIYHESLWGEVLEVRKGPAGGLVRWRHQRGESVTLGMWLVPAGTTFRLPPQ